MNKRRAICVAVLATLLFSMEPSVQAQGNGIMSSDDIRAELSRTISVLPPRLQEGGTTPPDASPVVSLPTIQFEWNSALLTADAQRQLDEVVKALGTRGRSIEVLPPLPANDIAPTPAPAPGVTPSPVLDGRVDLIIDGHTCSDGTKEYNQTLSESRAKSVRDYLLRQGVRANSINTRGFGPTRPVVANDGGPKQPRNRRVDIILQRNSPELGRTVKRYSDGPVSLLNGGLAPFNIRYSGSGGVESNSTGEHLPALSAGDRIRVQWEVAEGCYVYGAWRESNGRVIWMIHERKTGIELSHETPDDLVASVGRWCYFGSADSLPQGKDQHYTLGEGRGEEAVYLIATTQPIQDLRSFSAVIARKGKELSLEDVREASGGFCEMRQLIYSYKE